MLEGILFIGVIVELIKTMAFRRFKKHLTLANFIKILFILGLFLLGVLHAPQARSERTYGSNLPRAKSNYTGPGFCLPTSASAGIWCTPLCIGEVPGSAPLVGTHVGLPCMTDTFSPAYHLQPPAGGVFAYFLDTFWWDQVAFVNLRGMSSQEHGSRIYQTQMLGQGFDGQSLNQTSQAQQFLELEARRRNTPNEYSCVIGSNATAVSKSSAVSSALREGLKNDLEKRGAQAAGTTAAGGALADHQAKWEEYCQEFHDPESNNGASGCPSNEEENGDIADADADNSGEQRLINGDIDIEGVLFKDTINLANPHEYKAAKALLRNLVQPDVRDKPTSSAAGTSASRESILKQQHLEAVRNAATNIVADILSRRASVPSDGKSYIKEVRQKAGIPEEEISDNPSYNEMMLALTKERFYIPDYYGKVQRNVPAIRQEQAAVGAYINIQLNDIYKLQEQINTLTAARAALKFNQDDKSSQVGSSPVQ